jgi:3-oxoacyl-[acyl-carrier protein] reductase
MTHPSTSLNSPLGTTKTAVVTGAGRGIGKAIAFALARMGLRVVCVSKTASCQDVAQQLSQEGHEALALQVDVADSAAVQAACETLLAQYGSVAILVNNAGITRDGLMLRMSQDDWDSVISTNLTSAFTWTKHLLPGMTRARWGRIINISSVTGVAGNAGQCNYGAAKAGLIGFTRCLAKEVASRNITVNAIAPGFTQTDMTDALGDTLITKVTEMIPMKRFGKPEEIAAAVGFLCSDGAAYLTGQTLCIDGGFVCH